jgi:hypothetical protein
MAWTLLKLVWLLKETNSCNLPNQKKKTWNLKKDQGLKTHSWHNPNIEIVHIAH